MKNISAFIAGILLLGATALAQTDSTVDKSLPIVTERVVVGDQVHAPVLLLSDLDGVGKAVKGAPYTADAVTETTQTLADGNRIVNKTTAFLARDGEGRTRREENFAKIGGLQANAAKSVFINDPVTHIQYVSKPGGGSGEGTVFSTSELNGKPLHVRIESPEGKTKLSAGADTMYIRKLGAGGEGGDEPGSANLKQESLGTQVIEGVTAEGTRVTRTIPAGKIGNEKPLVITVETWRSPELQIVVLSKRSDPRFGETVYKLTDIRRGEPDPSLFQVPKDAKKDLF